MREFKNNLDFDNIKKLLRKGDCLKKKQERWELKLLMKLLLLIWIRTNQANNNY